MENRGEFEISGRWLKKSHQKFWRMKIEIFSGKGDILEIFHRVWKFVEDRGEIWNREGKCIVAWGGIDAPEEKNEED